MVKSKKKQKSNRHLACIKIYNLLHFILTLRPLIQVTWNEQINLLSLARHDKPDFSLVTFIDLSRGNDFILRV